MFYKDTESTHIWEISIEKITNVFYRKLFNIEVIIPRYLEERFYYSHESVGNLLK